MRPNAISELTENGFFHALLRKWSSSEVKGINADMERIIYESMTKNRFALRLLSIGVIKDISSVVQLPCEDPSPF